MEWGAIALAGLSVISAVAGAIALYYRIVIYRQAYDAGFKAAALMAAEREAERAKQRTRIDEDVGKLGPDDLGGELRDKSNRR